MGRIDTTSAIDLLVVGPESRATGGVARYVTEQRRRLPDDVAPRVYDVGTPEWETWQEFGLAVATSLRDAAAFPFQSPPDVAHVHSSHGYAFVRAAWYVLVATLLWQCPVVFHVHGSSFDEFVDTDSRPLAAFQSLVFDACDAVVVLSPYWRAQLSVRVDPAKLVVVPNAVDTDGYDPSFVSDTPHVTFVSNHVERKGIREFVEAVDHLLDEGVQFRTSIAGDGPFSDRAADLAERRETVEYLGYVSETEKRSLLDRSTIYVLPTYAEGLPIALLEGMAGGNAVVTTAVGSIPEIVDEANGRLVDPGDVDGLERAIGTLVDDPEAVSAMGQCNRELVTEEYSWDATAKMLASLYRATVESSSRSSRPGACRRA